ncbi:MAG: hypothetical protein ABI234_14430 [Ktedonobacteraceae bacterium]
MQQYPPNQPNQPQSYQTPYGQAPYPTQPPAPPKKKRRRWPWIVGSILVILIAIAAVNGGKSNTTTTTTPAGTTQANQPTTVQTTPKPSFVTFGDGTFTVGKDIQAGTYRTRTGSSGCYYARLKGFGGTIGEIISNDTTGAPAIVTIAASDKGFQSTNCGTWTADLSAITSSKTTFPDGTYFVGTDIAPGTYKSSGQSGCYYARLSGFGGTIGEITSNNTTDTAAIITIAPSDKGFTSTGCGTWTKQ